MAKEVVVILLVKNFGIKVKQPTVKVGCFG
jgi:hypothetical protein